MKFKDKATIVIIVGVVIFLAIDFYAAATDPTNKPQEDTTQSGVIQTSPVTSSTSTKSTETIDNPEIRIDIRSAAWIILALVLSVLIGGGFYRILDAVAFRIRNRENKQKTD